MNAQGALALDAARPAAQASWHHRQMLSLDLETTSADPELARIVSATVAVVGGGQPTDITSALVNPGIEIPQDAIDVHGITNERVRAEGQPPAEALAELVWVMAKMLVDWTRPLIIFNARYDLTVLDREARRHGFIDQLTSVRAYVVDPMAIDYHLDRYRTAAVARHTLADICRVYGAQHDTAHEAASDAISAARVAWAIAERGKVIRRTRGKAELDEAIALKTEWDEVRYDLPALHAAQKRWAIERSLQFAEWLESEHDDDEARERADAIRAGEARYWPVIPRADLRR